MNTFTIIRSVYRRLRSVPLLGTLVEAIRYRRFPVFATAAKRYAEQQALIEAHGHALAGLRQAVVHSQAAARQEFGTIRQALEAELYKQVHQLNQRLDEQRLTVQQQLEFQRQETLFEIRYRAPGQTAASPTATQPVAARIVNAEKLQQQRDRGGIRLNVGCGHKPDPERLNVDMRELTGVDIISTVDQLPFGPGEVQEIHSAHLLEHFPEEQLRRSLLPAWVALLRAGGEIRAVVPDAGAMLQAYANAEIDFSTLRLITFGGQEYEGDFHHTMFTPESLAELFAAQGLVNVRIDARGRRNGLCLECEVVGAKA